MRSRHQYLLGVGAATAMVAGTLAAFLSITAVISSGGIDAGSIGVPAVGGDGGAVEIQRSPPPRDRHQRHIAATPGLTTLPALPAGLVAARPPSSAPADGRDAPSDNQDGGPGRHGPARPDDGPPPSVPVAPPPSPGGTAPAPAQGPGGISPGPAQATGGISAPPVTGSGGFSAG